MLIPHFSSPMTRQFLTKEPFNKAAKICHVLLIIKIETERDCIMVQSLALLNIQGDPEKSIRFYLEFALSSKFIVMLSQPLSSKPNHNF